MLLTYQYKKKYDVYKIVNFYLLVGHLQNIELVYL